MKLKNQYFFYFFFAFIATLLNLIVQKSFEFIFTKVLATDLYLNKITINKSLTFGLFYQMMLATIIGFIFKYLIDKILIFKDKTAYLSGKHLMQIFYYGLFAALTTCIFWFSEISFKYFFNFNNSEYIGALIGLTIGYSVKFILDRKYVFDKNQN